MSDKQVMLIEDNPDDRDLTIRHSRKTTCSTPSPSPATAPTRRRLGVCSAAEAGQTPEPEACQVSPSIEPEVMDTVPPPGVAASAEPNQLDYPGNTTTRLATPPPLQGVAVP